MVKDVEGEKIATQWISKTLGGDTIQNRERGLHPGEKRDAKQVPINVLYGALTRGKPSADSPKELVGWAASGDTRFWEQERREPASQGWRPHLQWPQQPPFFPSHSGSGSEENKGGCFLLIWGLVSLKDKEGRAPRVLWRTPLMPSF